MRGRPSPFLSLTLAAFLLVPVAVGLAGTGTDSPSVPEPLSTSLESHAVPSHPTLQKSDAAASPYVDLVVSFRPGDDGAAQGDPRWVLGTPGIEALGLGRQGCITLAFTDLVVRNRPEDPRANLRIFEKIGSYPEHAFLDVSADGITYERYGLINGGTTDIDLSERIRTDNIRFIRLTDSGTNVYTSGTNSGYDLRGIQALVYDDAIDPTLGLLDDTQLRTSRCSGPL